MFVPALNQVIGIVVVYTGASGKFVGVLMVGTFLGKKYGKPQFTLGKQTRGQRVKLVDEVCLVFVRLFLDALAHPLCTA